MRTERDPARHRDLAAIHIAAGQLGLDRQTYESMLYTVGGPTARRDGNISAAHLDFTGRKRVLEHLRKSGWKTERPKAPPPARSKIPADRVRMVNYIDGLLREAGRTRAYVEHGADGRPSLIQRMFHVERFEWLTPKQLHDLLKVLLYDRGRRLAREAREREGHA